MSYKQGRPNSLIAHDAKSLSRMRSPQALEIIQQAKNFMNSPRASRSTLTPRSLPSLDINDLPLTPKGKMAALSRGEELVGSPSLRRSMLKRPSRPDADIRIHVKSNQSEAVSPAKMSCEPEELEASIDELVVSSPLKPLGLRRSVSVDHVRTQSPRVKQVRPQQVSPQALQALRSARADSLLRQSFGKQGSNEEAFKSTSCRGTQNQVHRTHNGRNLRLKYVESDITSSTSLTPRAPSTPQLRHMRSESAASIDESTNVSPKTNDWDEKGEASDSVVEFEFSLWKKATRTNLPPDALILEQQQEMLHSPQLHLDFSEADSHELPSNSLDEMDLHRLTEPGALSISVHFDEDRHDESDMCQQSSPMFKLIRSASPLRSRASEERVFFPSSSVKAPSQWKRGEALGEGTFGKVFMCLDGTTGELFAVKQIELPRDRSRDKQRSLTKLREEISLMNDLNHKHIVRYRGTDQDSQYFYIFMEYVPGGSIASMLSQFGVFNEDLIKLYTRQIIEGVHYLHSRNIVHRDIKGANVLVSEQGVAKLADFGCSKQLQDVHTQSLADSLHAIRGSVPWMAPEVVKQVGHDFKADIWSIGATIIEMASASSPWPAFTNNLSVLYAIATAKGPPEIPKFLSKEAKDFLMNCFRINPAERPTAMDLLRHPWLREK